MGKGNSVDGEPYHEPAVLDDHGATVKDSNIVMKNSIIVMKDSILDHQAPLLLQCVATNVSV